MAFELSPAYKTHLFFPEFDGLIENHERFLCVRTPSNNDFMWGNFLLFESPPKKTDLQEWKKIYSTLFPHNTWFMTFGWNRGEVDPGTQSQLLSEKFLIETDTVLIMDNSELPTKFNSGVTLQVVSTKSAWDFVTHQHIEFLCSGAHRSEQIKFEQSRFSTYQKMSEAGFGYWFVALLDGIPAGDMGIFFNGSVARFQEVLTYPFARRNGVCRSLCHLAAKYVRENHPINQFVTITDEAHARSAYLDIGFKVDGTTQGMRWYDPSFR
jgi:hypothetical protein